MLTLPNLLTGLRALGAPLFIWAGLSGNHDFLAFTIVALGGVTDYLDGKIARALNQTSRFGELADPAIDRVYIVAVLYVLLVRDVIPGWVVALIVIRDLVLGIQLALAYRRGIAPMAVTYLGKAATFNLLYAFPFLLLTLQNGALGDFASILGWSFAIWGIGLYLFTGATYFMRGLRTLRSERR